LPAILAPCFHQSLRSSNSVHRSAQAREAGIKKLHVASCNSDVRYRVGQEAVEHGSKRLHNVRKRGFVFTAKFAESNPVGFFYRQSGNSPNAFLNSVVKKTILTPRNPRF
jgi:hypothetical protein